MDELERLRRENLRLKCQLKESVMSVELLKKAKELENLNLAELIEEYDELFGHILGYHRMTTWINHFNHTTYSKKRVHRVMKKLNIHAVIRRVGHCIYIGPTEGFWGSIKTEMYQ